MPVPGATIPIAACARVLPTFNVARSDAIRCGTPCPSASRSLSKCTGAPPRCSCTLRASTPHKRFVICTRRSITGPATPNVARCTKVARPLRKTPRIVSSEGKSALRYVWVATGCRTPAVAVSNASTVLVAPMSPARYICSPPIILTSAST